MLKKTRNINLAIMGCLCAVFFLFAWENVQAVRLGYNIEKLRRDIKDLESSNTYLKKEIEASLSPEKLEERAKELGMVYPEPEAVVMLDEARQADPSRNWLAKVFR